MPGPGPRARGGVSGARGCTIRATFATEPLLDLEQQAVTTGPPASTRPTHPTQAPPRPPSPEARRVATSGPLASPTGTRTGRLWREDSRPIQGAQDCAYGL